MLVHHPLKQGVSNVTLTSEYYMKDLLLYPYYSTTCWSKRNVNRDVEVIEISSEKRQNLQNQMYKTK